MKYALVMRFTTSDSFLH